MCRPREGLKNILRMPEFRAQFRMKGINPARLKALEAKILCFAEMIQQDRQGVLGLASGPVGNLVPAGKARSGDDGAGLVADRRKQDPIADRLTDPVMLVPERTGHAAAAGIDFAHRQSGDQSQSALRPPGSHERLLLAMSVGEGQPVETVEFQVRFPGRNLIRQPAVEQKRTFLDARRRRGGKQIGVFIGERQEATRFGSQNGEPLIDEFDEPPDIPPGQRLSFLDEPFGNERPSAAPQPGPLDGEACAFQKLHGGLVDFGLAV